MIIGTILALPVIAIYPELLIVAGPVILIVGLGGLVKSNSYKNQWLGEILLFLSVGVGVTAGLQISYGQKVDSEVLHFGVMWGFVVLFLVHVNNFSHILTSSQAGIKNTVTKLGFDSAKIFLSLWWGACLIAWQVYHYKFLNYFSKWSGLAILIAASLTFYIKLDRVSSPVGSDLIMIRKKAYQLFMLMIFILFVERLSQVVALWTS